MSNKPSQKSRKRPRIRIKLIRRTKVGEATFILQKRIVSRTRRYDKTYRYDVYVMENAKRTMVYCGVAMYEATEHQARKIFRGCLREAQLEAYTRKVMRRLDEEDMANN